MNRVKQAIRWLRDDGGQRLRPRRTRGHAEAAALYRAVLSLLCLHRRLAAYLRCRHRALHVEFSEKETNRQVLNYTCAVFNLKDVSWWAVRSERMVEGAIRSNPAEKLLSNGFWKKEYFIDKVPLGEDRWAIVNPIDTVGTPPSPMKHAKPWL